MCALKPKRANKLSVFETHLLQPHFLVSQFIIYLDDYYNTLYIHWKKQWALREAWDNWASLVIKIKLNH